MLVKLLAGLMLVFVLIGATVTAAFAEEEATTEAETAAPEQEAGKASLSEDQILGFRHLRHILSYQSYQNLKEQATENFSCTLRTNVL